MSTRPRSARRRRRSPGPNRRPTDALRAGRRANRMMQAAALAGTTGERARVLRPRDRALFAHFLRRELTSRYLGSVTGLAWALLSPLALLAVYDFVFTNVFRATGF